MFILCSTLCSILKSDMKKPPNFGGFSAGDERIELPLRVLETPVIPFDQSPIFYFRYKETHLFRCFLLCTFKTTYKSTFLSSCFFLSTIPWLCPRPISNSQLHALLHFHLCPIYLVVFKGSYYFRMGYLILRGASRLDAFSVYPFPAWLPCHALGNATGTPAAGPSRSSRTKDSSSQISYAHAG